MTKQKVRASILALAVLLSILFILSFVYTLVYGVELWGISNKTVWGIAIVNFVFWIGNSHAGTLISAIFYLLRQDWRNSIHRIAETITIISILIAGLFPLIHLGRPWFFYWMLPLPNQTMHWANFKSPLIWDVVAVLAYALLSVLFWFLGIIPDYRFIKSKKMKALISKFWVGSNYHWNDFQWTYNLLAGILTAVVVSVHSIVSYDFSVSILPLWHSTMLPIFFVVGAIYSGVALILFCTTLLGAIGSFAEEITPKSQEILSKLLLAFSWIVLYFYLVEIFFVFYSQNTFEKTVFVLRLTKYFLPFYCTMITLTFFIPQLLWIGKFRRNKKANFIVSLSVVLGMWLERYLLIIPALSLDLVNKQMELYTPTIIDFMLTFGSVGLFVLFFYAIGKIIPLIPRFEN
ncbi:MAG: NrfD/PsrC family molybdoenzyme membrane anchor subunit [Candidatus Kapaibacteriota bacterium]